MKKRLISAILTAFVFAPSLGLASSLVIHIPGDTKPTHKTLKYQCADTPVTATYFKAGDISLVHLNLNGKHVVASRVISAGGEKYVADSYTWWTSRSGLSLSDSLKGDTPIACKLLSNKKSDKSPKHHKH
ncbi:MliC family protein [Bartonella sp. DGB2]|uniref:MliC family protein n=1 Tax=Bartonella sp. DGB2 TaxID=3388426 RepID=UPI00398FC6F8